VFNVAQTALAVSLGIVAYRLLGGISLFALRDYSLLEVSGRIVVPLTSLSVCYFVANSLAVCGAIALSTDGNVLTVWKQTMRGTWLYDLLSAPVVFICAWTYMELGPLGTLGLIIPVMGARQLYKTNRQLEQVNEDLLQLMVKAIEARDPYTSGHSRRVSHYSKIIARAIGLGTQHVERIGVAALLHDVGKIHEIYAPILRKPGKLTPDEWAIMQTHPVKSAELVATVSNLKDVIGAIRSHHENWDGSGYPDGTAGEGIPLGARIIKFADTIDAMTSDRPYRRALGEDEVRAELKKYAGIQFDPRISERLLVSSAFKLLFAAERRDSGPTLVPAHVTPRGREKATA
jgi:putative nucleotidyltransferase with HDIG domain